MKNNCETWKNYVETEEDKQVYERKNVKVVSIEVTSTSKIAEEGSIDDKFKENINKSSSED